MLLPRILSSVVLLPLIIGAILLGGWWFTLLAVVGAGLATWEMGQMATKVGQRPLTWLAVVAAVGFVLAADPNVDGRVFTVVLAGLVALPLAWWALRGEPTLLAVTSWALTVASTLYVGLLVSLYVHIRARPDGWQWVILALLANVASDTAAYFVGRSLGRHKLAPKVSPGKSIEGALGGLVGATVAVPILAAVLQLPLPLWVGPLLGLAISVAAQAGDLAESLIKRAFGVKDASHLIPGHGGVLDRLDSLVFTGIVVYHYLVWWH